MVSGWCLVICLVVTGTMEFYDFAYIGNFILPTDELICFRGVQTTNQITRGRDYMINDGLFVIIAIS